MSFTVELEGHPVVGLSMLIPWSGVGSATVTISGDVTIDGRVALKVGDVNFVCSVVGRRSYALSTTIELVMGGGGWRKLAPPRAHHNDAIARSADVASLLAIELGETITVDAGAGRDLEVDFVREAAEGARVLDQLFGRSWWVDPDGTTRAGSRPVYDARRLLVIDVDPRLRWASVSSDTIGSLLPGGRFSDSRLSESFTIHTSELWLEGRSLRARVWGAERAQNELGELFEGLVRQALPNARFGAGPYRYRVVEQAGDRLALQAVNGTLGLPDLPLVGVSPGVAGASASIAMGSVVYVDFCEGDPRLPLVRSLARRDDAGHVPDSLTIEASDSIGFDASAITIGSAASVGYALRSGDQIQISGVVDPGSGSVTGTLTLSPAMMASAGPPGVGRSKVSL